MADALHETAVQKMTDLIVSASAQEWDEFIRASAWDAEEK